MFYEIWTKSQYINISVTIKRQRKWEMRYNMNKKGEFTIWFTLTIIMFLLFIFISRNQNTALNMCTNLKLNATNTNNVNFIDNFCVINSSKHGNYSYEFSCGNIFSEQIFIKVINTNISKDEFFNNNKVKKLCK
jgi:hypothetical protein